MLHPRCCVMAVEVACVLELTVGIGFSQQPQQPPAVTEPMPAVLRDYKPVTAERLGNRPATCRKYYVHPAIMDAYLDGSLIESLGCASESTTPPSSAELHPEEKCIIKIIAKQAKAAAIP